MAFVDKGSAEDVETLVDTLTMDAAGHLNEANLTGLSAGDIQQLAELSHELHLETEMETDDSEVVIESIDNDTDDDDMMQSEIGAHEVEIETERGPSPEEILPDIKTTKTVVVPPLRPLSIAPKPAKVPITVKPMPGQQLVFLQGTGGSGHQAIKFVSSQGQELSLANLGVGVGRPVTLKPTVVKKVLAAPKSVVHHATAVSVSPAAAATSGGGMLMKTTKTMTTTPTLVTNKQGHLMMLQKTVTTTDHHQHHQHHQNQHQQQHHVTPTITTLPPGVKSLSLQQAQQMGLIPPNSKIVQQAGTTTKQQMVLTKPGGGTTKIKLVPHMTSAQLMTTGGGGGGGGGTPKTLTIKSPTKILPATPITSVGSGGGATKATGSQQRIVFKTSGGNLLPSHQILQVAGTQALNSGQLHQINIPGKGIQFIKFVAATSAETVSTANVIKTTSAALGSTSTNIVLSEVKPNIAPKPLKTIAVKTPNSGQQQVLMLPTYMPSQMSSAKVPIPMRHTPVQAAKQPVTVVSSSITTNTTSSSSSSPETITIAAPAAAATVSSSGGGGGGNITPTSLSTSDQVGLESNGMRPRKPCNCTKSQCLKLYCDCFANGEFCYMCNCMNCFNNLENEDHRQRAIKTCLERNPSAFRPKIGKAKDVPGDSSVRKHTKGCNCKRSGCLKNYCECYEAKIACSNNCKCVGCRNIEDSMEKRGMRSIHDDPILYQHQPVHKMAPIKDIVSLRPRRSSSNTKQPINFITDDVVEATCQCMLTVSDHGESSMQDVELTMAQVIEEFGRCLTEIIAYSSSSTANAANTTANNNN